MHTRSFFSDYRVLWRRTQGTPLCERNSSMLSTRIHGWVSDKVVTQQFNQIKEFEELLYERGTTISKFFLYIFNNEQKGRFVDASRGGNGRDTTSQLFSIGRCDVGRISFHRGIEPPRATITASFSKITSLVFTLPVGMFCANVLMRGKLMSPLICFSNVRKRNL